MLKKPATAKIKLSDLLQLLGAAPISSGNPEVSGICPLDQLKPQAVTFLTMKHAALCTPQLLQDLTLAKIAALIIPENINPTSLPAGPILIKVPDPLRAVITLVPLFYEKSASPPGVSPKADVDPSVKLGAGVHIGAFSSIAALSEIGERTVIHPNVTIYAGTRIGKDCVIHAGAVIREECELGDGCVVQNGAVIGADGFGYLPDPAKGLTSVPQVGNVKISAQVDIGANSCIDRAALGSTIVGRGSKIDNLVQVGHNVRIGEHSLLCGQAGVAGSVKIGNGCVLGGQSGVADHLTLADGVRLAAQTGVTGNLSEKGDYAGFPAIPARVWRRQLGTLSRLAKNIKLLEKLFKDSKE